MSEVKVVRDEQGNAIVIIPDIIFWNKQDIDWDAVKEYLKKYLGEIIENKQTKEKIKIGILFGIYGKLLTEKQYELLNDYYNNDLSLSEIAENNNITRQAVNDVINKGKNKLIEIEKIGILIKKHY